MGLFFDTFREALGSIFAHKSRATLTLLGVIIGIASVVTVIAAGEGSRQNIVAQFESFSPRTLQIMPNNVNLRVNSRFRPVAMDNTDLENLERFVPEIEDIAPVMRAATIVKAGDVEKRLTVTGTVSQFIEFVDFELATGRVITEEEVERFDKVAVVGSLIVDEFFHGQDPVGQYFTAFDTPLRIVGTLKRKEKASGISIIDPDQQFNNVIVVPLGVFKRVFGNNNKFQLVMANVKSLDLIPAAKQRIVDILGRHHGLWDDTYDKFMVTSMSESLEMINSILGAVTIAVSCFAGIALLIAAIGIMNIMLVAVRERTREIGIRKALGAKRSTILLQFLVETVLLTGGGGLVGLGLAFAASSIIGAVAQWPLVISFFTCLLSVGISLATGLLSGLYPAYRAAKLQPQEALRYE